MHHLTKKLTALAMFAALVLIPTTKLLAGNLDSPADPTSSDSAMYTLKDIYDRLNTNKQATKRPGGFTEPDAGPDSTGYTLNQVYEKAIPTQVPKTGQTTSYGTRDDGALQQGVAWPNSRFYCNPNGDCDNSDGTVTDNLTGLMWVKAPHSLTGNLGTMNWNAAIDICNGLTFAGHSDWRLPNVRELQSLVDYGRSPALPSGHPFTAVQSSYYWSSTTGAGNSGSAWVVSMFAGDVNDGGKTSTFPVWPVRAGQ